MAAWLAEGLNQADRQTPYTLLAGLLARPCPNDNESGRRAMLRRLGPEADDPLDATLSAALTYEQAEVPSLQGFVAWMQADDSGDQARDGKRGRRGAHYDRAWRQRFGSPAGDPRLFARSAAQQEHAADRQGQPPLISPSASRAADAALARKAELHRAMMEEYHRLLYVALTRAEDWLVAVSWDNFRAKKEGPDLSKGHGRNYCGRV